MTVGSLFAGIGGFDLAATRVFGPESVRWQVEIDPWARRVLTKHWPDVPKFGDIREITGDELEPVGLVCGGFPCQPVSRVGRQLGTAHQHWLWPEMRRVVAAVQPAWVVAENTPGLQDMGLLDTVCGDLEDLGYEVRTLCIPACAVGAPHLRDRIWILSHAHRFQLPVQPPDALRPRRDAAFNGGWWDSEPGVGRVADGVPSGVDRYRTAALGNAIVPQVAELLFRWIQEAEGATP